MPREKPSQGAESPTREEAIAALHSAGVPSDVVLGIVEADNYERVNAEPKAPAEPNSEE